MKPGFYNANLSRFFPLVVNAAVTLPHEAVVDFGSMCFGGSGFVEGQHLVRLRYIRCVGTALEFIFECDAPGLADSHLIFQRSTTDDRYDIQFTRAQPKLTQGELEDPDEPVHEPPAETCEGSLWDGYLVTGDLTVLYEWLVAEFVGDVLLYDSDAEDAQLEPAITIYQGDHQVRKIGVANLDRVRATTADDCRELCWPTAPEELYVVDSCLIGEVRLEDGYNLNVRQYDAENSVFFEGQIGGGRGEPTSEVPVYLGELVPSGRDHISGSLSCCQVVRSINGAGGPVFLLTPGLGVEITEVPNQHRLIVDVNLKNMAVCLVQNAAEPVECLYPDEDPCVCGPADLDDFECPAGSITTTTTTTTLSPCQVIVTSEFVDGENTGGINEIQEVAFNGGTAGFLLLELTGYFTFLGLDISDPLVDWQTTFSVYASVASITDGFRFTFDKAATDKRNLPQMTVFFDGTSPGVTISTILDGQIDNPAVQTFTFSPPPISGNWTLDGESFAFDEVPEVTGWSVVGAASSGLVVVTRDTGGSGATELTWDEDTLSSCPPPTTTTTTPPPVSTTTTTTTLPPE